MSEQDKDGSPAVPSGSQDMRADLEALRSEVEELRERLAALEALPRRAANASATSRGGEQPGEPSAGSKQRPPLESPAVSRAAETAASATPEAARAAEPERPGMLFSRLAWACFVLVGALILRTATRQGWWAPGLGTAIGLGYCALLLVGPYVVERLRRPWDNALVFELGGSALAPLIVLEMVNRSQAVSMPLAATTLGAVIVLSSVIGAFRKSPAIVGVVLFCGVGAVGGLGASAHHVVWRASVVVLAVGLALLFAHRERWGFLRPLVLIPALLLLLGAALLSPRWDPTQSARNILILSGVAIWGLIAASSFLRLGALDAFERAILPLASLWLYGLVAHYAPAIADPAAAAAAVLLIVVCSTRAVAAATQPTLDAFGFAAAALAGVSLARLDGSGLSLALAALAVQRVGRRQDDSTWLTLSTLLLLEALVVVVLRQGLFGAPPRLAAPVLAGLGLAVLALAHYLIDLRRGHELAARWRSLAALGVSLLPTAAAVRLLLPALGSATVVTLAQGGALGLASLVTLYAGRRKRLPEAVALGLLGIVLMGGKALAWDILRLDGGPMVAGVVLFGIAAGVTSLILRRPVPAAEVSAPEEAPPAAAGPFDE